MGHETEDTRAWLDALMDGTTPGPWRRDDGTEDLPVLSVVTDDASVLSGSEGWPCGSLCGSNEDTALAAAAPDLAARLLSALDRIAEVEAERDRLARILAVERGDESAAPEGWRFSLYGVWRRKDPRGGSVDVTRATTRGWGVVPVGRLTVVDIYPTALEAMEAADAARGGDDG